MHIFILFISISIFYLSIFIDTYIYSGESSTKFKEIVYTKKFQNISPL